MTQRKLLLITDLLFFVCLVFFIDYQDRYGSQWSKFGTAELEKQIFQDRTPEATQRAFETLWHKNEFQFPHTAVAYMKLCRNLTLTSRLTSVELTEKQRSSIIEFVNNPDNFDWGETTWGIKDSEYILRCFHNSGKEVGKIWLSGQDCGILEIRPFTPAAKYGGLSEKGRSRIQEILRSIYD